MAFLVYDQAVAVNAAGGGQVDKIVFLDFSAFYHTFNCHPGVVATFLSMDLLGIISAILRCYIVGLYYILHYHSFFMRSYMLASSVVIVSSVPVVTSKSYVAWKHLYPFLAPILRLPDYISYTKRSSKSICLLYILIKK